MAFCNACASAMTKKKSRETATEYIERQKWQRIEIDIVGPFVPSIPSKFKYVMAFAKAGPIGYVTTVCIVDTTESTLIKRLSEYLEAHPEVRELLFDTALDTENIKAMCENMKIQHRCIGHGSHHKLGHVERFSRTLQEHLIILITDAQCNAAYWPMATEYFVTLFNTLPRRHKWKSNYEVAGFGIPNVTNYHQFGLRAYKYIEPASRPHKFSNKRLLATTQDHSTRRVLKGVLPSSQCLFYAGWSFRIKQHILFDPDTNRITSSGQVLMGDSMYFKTPELPRTIWQPTDITSKASFIQRRHQLPDIRHPQGSDPYGPVYSPQTAAPSSYADIAS